MRANSLDLRKRVIGADQAGERFIRELAEQFHVTKNIEKNWLPRLFESGTLSPWPHGGGVPPVVSGERLDTLCRLVGEHDEAMLDELRRALERGCRVRTRHLGHRPRAEESWLHARK